MIIHVICKFKQATLQHPSCLLEHCEMQMCVIGHLLAIPYRLEPPAPSSSAWTGRCSICLQKPAYETDHCQINDIRAHINFTAIKWLQDGPRRHSHCFSHLSCAVFPKMCMWTRLSCLCAECEATAWTRGWKQDTARRWHLEQSAH